MRVKLLHSLSLKMDLLRHYMLIPQDFIVNEGHVILKHLPVGRSLESILKISDNAIKGLKVSRTSLWLYQLRDAVNATLMLH